MISTDNVKSHDNDGGSSGGGGDGHGHKDIGEDKDSGANGLRAYFSWARGLYN